MHELALGSFQLPTGYFVRRAAPLMAIETPALNMREDGALLVHSHAGVSSLKDAALSLIEEAQRTIFLASFLIGDRDLLQALERRAQRLHGGVYIVTAMSDEALARGFAEVDEMAPAGEQARAKQFSLLARRGLAIRGHDECHAKFLVIDGAVGLVSTANFDTPGFEKTTEIGMVLRDREEVVRLRSLFRRLWQACTWEVSSEGAYVLTRRDPTKHVGPVRTPTGSEREVVWTANDEHYIHKRVEAIVGRADRELLLSSFSLRGLSERNDVLVDSLAKFRKRARVAPRLLVRARNQMEAMRRDAATLSEVGVEVLADDEIHIKAVVGDGREAALFSANFEVEKGLQGGVEAGVRFTNERLVSATHSFLKSLLANARYEFRPRLTVSELSGALARADRWPFAATFAVSATDAVWQALTDASSQGPALFEQTSDDVELFVGTQRFRVSDSARLTPEIHLVSVQQPPTEALLGRWLREGRVEGRLRGLCDATLRRALR